MELKVVDSKNINRYVEFCKEVYRGNPFYRDIMSPSLSGILFQKAQICKSSIIKPFMILDSDQIVAVCTYVIVDRMSDTLQLAYFEAMEGQSRALDMIIQHGKIIAREHGINKLLVGLNFHVNYGLGLLADHYDKIQSFGSSYNPSYYIDYFKRYADEEINLISYLADVKDLDFGIDDRLMNRIRTNFNVRQADFKELDKEAELYTDINNQAFSHHRFYYQRRVEEDLELFNDFKLFLKPENLLFLEHDGKAIGFMLWYPDFNELIKEGETIGFKTFIRNKLFSKKIKKFKIVELGVIPKYQKKGAVLALFDYCHKLIRNRYEVCESGWILDNNFASLGFGERWADKVYKSYKAYIISV